MLYSEGDSAEQQMRKNVQSIPPVTDRKMGELGPYGERVRQRRLMVVTDDYVLVADDLQGGRSHTFDQLWQMKEFTGLTAGGRALDPVRHTPQFNPDPHGSGQFITDCDWYQADAPTRASFTFRFGPGSDNAGSKESTNEPGVLDVDVHGVWPPHQELMVAMPPETHGTAQWVTWSVAAAGTTLAHGESGMWILGQSDIDVALPPADELVLSVASSGAKKQALFWAGARLVGADGVEHPIIGMVEENVSHPAIAGRDYAGGPIVIGGERATTALPTQPQKDDAPAIIHVPLKGTGAMRFRARLGADFPLGDQTQRRKVFSIRSSGTTARFLTVLEPHEGKRMVVAATATGPDEVRVELADGRVQELAIHGLDGAANALAVELTERRDGQVVRSESTKP